MYDESKRKKIIEQLIKKGLIDANNEQITTRKLVDEVEEGLEILLKNNIHKQNETKEDIEELL